MDDAIDSTLYRTMPEPWLRNARRLGWLDAEPAILHGRYRSTYEALRRSDHELAVAGRAFWASALAAYESIRPRDAADVIGRFRSDDHRHHVGACLELTSAVLLPKMGIALTTPLDGNPDFEGFFGSLPLTMECTAITALDDNTDAKSLQTEVIAEAIKGLRLDGLKLKVRIHGKCTHAPSIRRIQDYITTWIDAHPTLRSAAPGSLRDLGIEPLKFEVHGAVVWIEPMYRAATTEGSAFGMLTGDGCFVGSLADAVTKAIKDKASEYNNRPLLLVLGLSSAYGSIDEIIDGMFGPNRYTFPRGVHAVGVTNVVGERGIGGALFNRETRRQHVLGVLAIAGNLQFPWLASMALIPNPSTSFALHGTALVQLLESAYGVGDVSALIQRQLTDDRPLRTLLGVPV